ncbi:hypothetical protein EP7_004425 [Isosphaeraceae bacterium EP7]
MGKLEVSQRRIDANRRNAQRSTGPRTAEGKEKSRRNSLIHGLAGSGVVVPECEAQAAQERGEQLVSSLRPMNAFEMGLVETIAIEGVRIDRCRIEERLVRDVRARRAVACWGDERKAEAAKLGRTLADRPDEVAARLATTSAGCDWLIARWRALGKGLDKNGGWTAEQKGLAHDLLGIAAELRELDSPLNADEGEETLSHLRELVEGELEGLYDRKEGMLDEIDEDLREATSMGLIAVDDPTLVLLRRYETASFRRQRWALDMLQKGRQRRETAPLTMSDDYRERPRDTSYVRPPAREFPDTDPAPDHEPVPPASGPDRGNSSEQSGHSQPPGDVEQAGIQPQSAPVLRTERTHQAVPTRFAERSHLSGLFRRLARSLVGLNVAALTAKPLARPARRLCRPSVASRLPARAGILRLLAAPAA